MSRWYARAGAVALALTACCVVLAVHVSRYWYLAAVVVGVVTLAVCSAWLRRADRIELDRRYRSTGFERMDEMSGVEFEDFVAAILRHSGYAVTATQVTGDYGVDLVAVRDGVHTAVQCKRQARPVGVGAVQEAVAGRAFHGCTATMVVTNHSFTRAARTLAQVHRCDLVDRPRLEHAVSAWREQPP